MYRSSWRTSFPAFFEGLDCKVCDPNETSDKIILALFCFIDSVNIFLSGNAAMHWLRCYPGGISLGRVCRGYRTESGIEATLQGQE